MPPVRLRTRFCERLLSLGHPAKMDYRFIPLVNKKRMLSALSIVTPPFLSICSFLLKVSCRWVVLWSCYPSIKTRTFYILMPFSYSPLIPFGLASSLTPLLCTLCKVIRLHVHRSFVQTGSCRLRPLYLFIYVYISVAFLFRDSTVTGTTRTFLPPISLLSLILLLCSGTIRFLGIVYLASSRSVRSGG